MVFDKRRKTWAFLWCADGKRTSRRIGTLAQFPTKGAAWRAVEVLPAAAPQLKSTAVTVNDLIVAYRAEKMPTRYSTKRSYEVWLRNYVVPRWGNCDLEQLQPRPVELWLESLALAPRSKVHVRGMLRRLLDYAQWSGVVATSRNPMTLVHPRGGSKRLKKPRSLTVEEFQQFAPHLQQPFKEIALLCVCLGLRISEALALRWSDVNWLEGKLTVERGIVMQRVDTTKTVGSERAMSIAAELLAVLAAWKRVTRFSEAGDWIFASPMKLGRLPWSYDQVLGSFQKAAQAAGIGKVGTHTMRHSYRAWLDSVGTGLGVQQRLMRHSSITMTMDCYGDVITNEQQVANSKVAGLALADRVILTN